MNLCCLRSCVVHLACNVSAVIGAVRRNTVFSVQPPGAKGKRVNIPDPVCWKCPRQKGRRGNANELGDDGGSSWKSSLFFVRSVFPGKLL
jgi:hypothetical protein